MDIALSRYLEGHEFAKVEKHLRDANGISIGRSHENPMKDTIVYYV